MSIWSSLYTSSSGIAAYGNAMGVVGDNVANVGTTGFKGSRAGFAAILGGIGTNQQRVGAGVLMSGAEVGFGQGSLQQTGRNLDMAVWGDGWFVMEGNHQGVDGQYFTRDGRFSVDQEGFLVNPGGLRLQGYMFGADGETLSPSLGDLEMQSVLPPNPTSELGLQVRLDDAPKEDGTPATYETSVRLYDEAGRSREVVFEFVYAGSDQWDWTARVDGSELEGGTTGTPTDVGNGTVSFDSDGSFLSSSGQINPMFAGNVASQVIDIDFEGSNGYAGGFDLRYDQDGFGAGTAEDYRINEEGIIEALYSNGEARKIGRVALATFKGEADLERQGSQLFRETPGSGNPSIGAASTAGRGSIASGAVEGSNVDLSTELVTMITYQRAFQANARAVSTADEMLAETANIKR